MAFIRTTANAISSGGTINGDITITGDLTVEGGGSLSFDEVIEGTQVIDVTDTEAFLVRKNGDGGDLFTVDTTNSDVAVGGLLTIDQDTVGSNAITIDTEATTGRGIDIAADALTSGHIAYFYSNSSSTTGRNLVEIHNDNASANAAIPLKITQDAPANAFNIDMNGNRNSINIASDSTTYHTMYTIADSLTTGSMAYFKSNSSSTSTRNLVEIHNDHASATGATGLKIINDSTGSALTAVGAAGSGSASGAVVKLQTAETTVVDGDYLGRIEFSAPSEADGSDAILTGAQIHAEASDTFSGTVNKTDLVFSTGASEAAVERMRINSAGQFGLNVDNQDSYYAAEFVLGASNQGGITIRGGTSDTGQYLMFADGASGAARYQGYIQYAHSDNQMHLATGASERMTIDATGVGIGTTDPSTKLDVSSGHIRISTGYELQWNTGATKLTGADSYLIFDVNSAERMRISSAGNLGVGVTPETTNSSHDAIQLGGNAYWNSYGTQGAGGETDFGHNFYFSAAGSDKYISTDEATQFRQGGGAFVFKSAASGSADAAITWTSLMKLDINSRVSLSNNDSGTSNTILGKSAGDLDGAGDKNVFVGELAGGTGTQTDAADNNVGVGYGALTDLTTGADNTSIGQSSLAELTTGSYNTSVGRLSTTALTAGSHNVVIGRANLYAAADDESNNIVIGNSAMGSAKQNGTASATNREVKQNVAIGTDALAGGTLTGTNHLEGNVAIGHLAMDATGANNQIGSVAIGSSALSALTSGAGNTAIGYKAGNLLSTGSNSTIIGYDADVDANDRAGCIVIGSGLSLNTASDNVVEIGNDTNSMTYDLDGGDITVTSDVRTKTNIKDSNLGLEFINKLRPVTYETKPSAEYPKEFGVKNPVKKKSRKTWDGLIAQEVKQVMDDMGVEFSGWSEGINTKQTLAYGKLVMPLIKAVQELSAKVAELEKK